MAKLKKPKYHIKGYGGKNKPKNNKPIPISLMRDETKRPTTT